MSSGDMAETRAAASSIARGMPSSRWQISTTDGNVGIAKRERRIGRRGPLGEQPDSLRRGGAVEVGAAVTRARRSCAATAGQDRDRSWRTASPGTGERLAAGRQDVQARRAREQPFGKACDAVDEVLGVVEQEQQVLVGEERRDGRDRRDAGDLRRAERARDLGRDLRRVAERRQLREPHAVGVAVDEAAGSLEHQPGLAGPARADERHEPVTLDERRDSAELLLASDEARQLDRQVGAARAQRAERREGPWRGRRRRPGRSARAGRCREAGASRGRRARPTPGADRRASTAATAEQMIWPPWAMARIRATRLRAGPK